MNEQPKQPPAPNYAAYWAAALERYRERIAAGCISPVGAIRVGTKKEETEEQGDE